MLDALIKNCPKLEHLCWSKCFPTKDAHLLTQFRHLISISYFNSAPKLDIPLVQVQKYAEVRISLDRIKFATLETIP